MRTSATTRVVGPYVRPVRRRLWTACALVLVESGVVLLRPWPLALAVDRVLAPDPTEPDPVGAPLVLLSLAALAGLLLTVVAGLLRMASERLAEGTAEVLGHEVRRAVFGAAMSRSLRWHDRTRGGELVSRVTTDVGRVLDALVALTTTLVPELLLLLGVLVVLALVDVQLALVGLGVVPVLAWLTLDQRRRVRAAESAAREASGALAVRTQDLLRHVRAVQAFGRADLAGERFGAASRAVAEADTASLRVASRWTPTADAVLAVGTALVLLVGGSQVLSQELSLGALLVVVAYLRDLYGPVRSLTRLSSLLAKADVSARRLLDVLESHEPSVGSVGAAEAPCPSQGLRVSRLGFSHRPGRPVLHDLDLEVRTGETVCLLGPSGSGKSTLLHLLLRLYEPDSGRILLDGVDVRAFTVASLRSRFAFMPQEPWLLDDTIAANVALGRRGATRTDVDIACARAAVTEFTDRLPLGLDTPVGEDGLRLSGGERRRLALARAVVSPAPVMLLDEPTASLDAECAATVVRAVARAARGRSALVVTHDPRLAEVADRVVTLHPAAATRPVLGRRPTPPRDREEVAP